MRVLVACGSAMYRSIVHDGLAELVDVGEALFAHDVPTALSVVSSKAPDLIIADSDLGGDSGESPSDLLRSGSSPVQFVLLADDEEAVIGIRSEGAVRQDVQVLLKPWSLDRAVTVAELTEQLRPAVHRASHDSKAADTGQISIFVVGASTGGPLALRRLLAALPKDLGAAVVIVQHMLVGFVRPMAEQLERVTPLDVVVAEENMAIRPGMAVIAPAQFHLTVERRSGMLACAHLTTDPPVQGCRPAVDVLATSAAEAFGPQTGMVILTGIGADGTAGAKAVRAAGGRVIAQSEHSSSVYGMPRAAAEAGVVDDVLALEDIPVLMARWAGRSQ